MYFKAGLDSAGKPHSWLQRTVYPPIGSIFDEKEQYGTGELSLGFLDMPFDVPNIRAENGPAEAHLRIGWLRSVANIYHAFGIQSFMDELAHAAGKDPIEYWLAALGDPRNLDIGKQNAKYGNYGKPLSSYPLDTGRLRKVVEVVAEQSGWANKKPGNGRAWGFAAHRSFLTYVAAVVEVEVDKTGKVRIPRVDLAVDCGSVINPDRVKAQFEGAAVFGTSIAMLGEITAADGRVKTRQLRHLPSRPHQRIALRNPHPPSTLRRPPHRSRRTRSPHRSRPPSPTPSSPPPANASANSPSAKPKLV